MWKLDQILTIGQHLKSVLQNDYKLARNWLVSLLPNYLLYTVKILLEVTSPQIFSHHEDNIG